MAKEQNNECDTLREGLIDALTKLRDGDFSARLKLDSKHPADRHIADLFNEVVALTENITGEFGRLSQTVGKEGKIAYRAGVKGASGGWQAKLDAVNELVDDMVQPTTEVARVIGAVAKGDLSQHMATEIDGRQLKGEFLRIGKVVNTMVDQLGSFASEVTRVAREVGTEGKLGGQARVKGVAGTWKDLTDNVNLMADNLTGQVRNIAEVTTAVARGDLSKKITVDVKGEILELKDTINTMVDQLNGFASEVTRVAREVGTEGKLGGQAEVPGVAGTWADLTDNVNLMADNLTGQVRNIAEVTTAVARGDLSKKITVEVRGEILELKNTINVMVDQLSSFASEVSRVAREVGTEGRLGGQAKVDGVAGIWKDLTDNVNELAANLTGQVRNIAEVTTAVASGDLSKKITVDVKGEIAELKNTINTMVDQLGSFASEVTRVAREVGTEGKLGGQAKVEGVAGTWADLTDNVNELAANLTGQVRNIAEVTTAVASGDLSKKITVDVKGEIAELKNTINTMVDQLNSFASEVTRVAREVGTEGKLGGQARVPGVAGTWQDLTENVNLMADNLTGQVRNIAEVTTAVARGDLSKKVTVDVKGEIAELKNTVNTMVDQLNGFASEVTRVAREVGTEGKLGGQAMVPGVGGTWADLTDNVNLMATNLTNQVRGIADVVTAVAQGNLNRKLTLEAKGEIAALAETINGMIETLSTFGDQVTNMAREVGVEGKLGGQARVPGAAGLWRDLTDNVNQLAENLTNQVRSIADVATAVTKGDLTRSISVEASGEMASLKDNINEMIRNLKDQTLKNAEQDWLKTNLARFARMLQGERDLATISNLIMSELAPLVNAQYGVFYVAKENEGQDATLDLVASYGAGNPQEMKPRFVLREGLIGQAAADKSPIRLDKVPDGYLRVSSGLGDAKPAHLFILPALFEDEVKAVLELGSFEGFSDTHHGFLIQLMETIGIVLNTIASTMRTEELLKESQTLTQELQARQTELTTKQKELAQTNEELQEKAQLLEYEKRQVEAKNLEIDMARRAIEEKAEQLALTSKYKSEFLANMSHELRTPLNSLLILSKVLNDNEEGNLSQKQTEFAKTIHSAGSDLLNLINDILDLSKIESGTVSIELDDMRLSSLSKHVERTFRQLASQKGLGFEVEFASDLPKTLRTDEQRLQQILLNLLSNAFKFTSEGKVSLDVRMATSGWNREHPQLSDASRALAISVTDTGIGIPEDKQKLIFEAFQQADGTTSRKYGGTGLGLSISREIAGLLGGELQVSSTYGKGSTFTLYLPLDPPKVDKSSDDTSTRDQSSHRPLHLDREHDQLAPSAEPFVLIVTGDSELADRLTEEALAQGMATSVANSGAAAISTARRTPPVAVAVDTTLDDMDAMVLVDMLANQEGCAHRPIWIIEESGNEDGQHVSLHSRSNVLTSPRGEAPEAFRKLKRGIDEAGNQTSVECSDEWTLDGRHILIVDDDIRNIFSLASVLESRGASVVYAERGADGIEMLRAKSSIDAALIDIMMPEMDGYETMQRIRQDDDLAGTPLIAVTAKAMRGDRLKCLEAGADDYISKPVDIELLMAVLRVAFDRAARQPTEAADVEAVK
ncbi:HAMP domain-containing protein [Qipengyuania mesophila]|uniref:HAMP domain-containing protein n=1 Tax=Qipengyuania mesophila TaxID=2867246 RepID=UPI0035124765